MFGITLSRKAKAKQAAEPEKTEPEAEQPAAPDLAASEVEGPAAGESAEPLATAADAEPLATIEAPAEPEAGSREVFDALEAAYGPEFAASAFKAKLSLADAHARRASELAAEIESMKAAHAKDMGEAEAREAALKATMDARLKAYGGLGTDEPVSFDEHDADKAARQAKAAKLTKKTGLSEGLAEFASAISIVRS